MVYRTYASETSQFLAPYEVSQKSRPAPQISQSSPGSTLFGSEQNVQQGPLVNSVRPSQLSSSMSNSELSKAAEFTENTVRKKVAQWNPFEDPTPFSQMTEDHIIDAEFEAIRQRGSQTSKSNALFFSSFYYSKQFQSRVI